MKTTKRKVKSPVKASPQRAAEAAPTASSGAIVLGTHCTLKDAAALKDALCKAADDAAPLDVDVTQVERIDTATMQVLCAFARDRAARDRNVVFKGDSLAWREAVRLLGIGELLGSARADMERTA